MKGASVRKVILRFFLAMIPSVISKNFNLDRPPPLHFLSITQNFLTNIICQYFSFNIWVVYDHLELHWCIFDQNWAKSKPWHFQLLQILNATDRGIVQWVTFFTASASTGLSDYSFHSRSCYRVFLGRIASHSHSRIVGIDFFHSLPVLEFWE